MKKLLLYIVLPLLIVAVGFGTYYYLYQVTNSYVMIDINPSIELEVNRMDQVINVTGLNEDGIILLADLELVGLSTEEASTIIVDNATDMGYIDEFSIENEIVVTAYCDDDKVAEELELKIQEKLEKHLGEEKIPAQVMTRSIYQEKKALAEEKEVSLGKYLYIEKVAGMNSELDKEKLYDMSIKDINSEFKKGETITKVPITEHLKETKEEMIEAKEAELKELGEELWQEEKQINSGFSEENKTEEIKTLINQEKNAVMNEFQETKGSSKSNN